MTNIRIVIIGGGIAGLAAAEAAKTTLPGAEVTLILYEPELPYSRLNLTKYIAGETERAKLEIHGPDWYRGKGIAIVNGEAASLNRQAKTVALSDGTEFTFDRLVVATGSSAFLPPIQGVNLPGVLCLRTKSDADAIIAQAGPGKRCACIGGGILGLELAAGLAKRGSIATVLEASQWLMPRQLAQPAAEMLSRHIGRLGLTVICGAKVERIGGAVRAERVCLSSGEEISAEAVLISAGVRLNIAIAAASSLKTARGIIVDSRMATSDPDIFAAGDVAEHAGSVPGLWPVAMEQGAVAGTNAAGGHALYTPKPAPAILKVVGLDVFSIGDFNPEGPATRIYEEKTDDKYIRLALREGRVVGANMVGDIGAARLVRNAVEKGMPANTPALLGRFPGLAAQPSQ